MADYKITRISDKAPSTWEGPAGTIYYTRVMLEGHSKPVEIGKKKPNALSVGMTVSGDIKPDRGEADKFKAAPMASGGFGGASIGNSSKPAYQPKDEHAIAKAVALKAAVDFAVAGKFNTFQSVLDTAGEFLSWLEADKHKLDTTPDPMDKVHAQNPLNDNFGEVEYINTQDLPPDF